ncbi:hypothetical protein ACFY3U_21175 [Micromonospora sp. NPDC000089]|uniref:hypothetical protein n=1 Tax=unclassified Micromonospora TaxID=2617518 RepID=UPI0036994921
MAKHRRPSADDPSTGPATAEPPESTYWSVQDCPWPAVSPSLPAEMVELLAPPIVVGVARVPVTSRATPPAGRVPARRPAPGAGPSGRHRRRGRGPNERG